MRMRYIFKTRGRPKWNKRLERPLRQFEKMVMFSIMYVRASLNIFKFSGSEDWQ